MKDSTFLRMDSKQFLAVAVTILLVFSAGCAGWGTDGPANPEPDSPDEANADSDSEGDSNSDSNSDTNSNPNADDTDADSDDDTDSGDATDSNSDSESEDRDTDSDSDSDSETDGDEPVPTETAENNDTADDPSADADGNTTDDRDSTPGSDDGDTDAGESADDGGEPDSNPDSEGESDSDPADDAPESYTYTLVIAVADDGEYGEGVEGEEVTVEYDNQTETYYTNARGIVELSFENEQPDEAFEYTVTVQDETKTITVTEGYNALDFTVPYIPVGGPQYTLTVHAGETVAATGAEITVSYPDATDGAIIATKTAEDGSVTFDLPDGEYVVSGEDVNGNTEERTVTIDEEDKQIVLAGLYPKLPEETELRVTVVDADGTLIEGAQVDGISGRHPMGNDILVSGETGSDGVAVLSVFEGYSYTLNAFYDGEVSDTVDVHVEAGTDNAIEIQMDSVDLESSEESESGSALVIA